MAVALAASAMCCPSCAQAGVVSWGHWGPSNAPSIQSLQSLWAFGTASLGQESGLVCRNTWQSGDTGKRLGRWELEILGSSKRHGEHMAKRSRGPCTDSELTWGCGHARTAEAGGSLAFGGCSQVAFGVRTEDLFSLLLPTHLGMHGSLHKRSLGIDSTP